MSLSSVVKPLQEIISIVEEDNFPVEGQEDILEKLKKELEIVMSYVESSYTVGTDTVYNCGYVPKEVQKELIERVIELASQVTPLYVVANTRFYSTVSSLQHVSDRSIEEIHEQFYSQALTATRKKYPQGTPLKEVLPHNQVYNTIDSYEYLHMPLSYKLQLVEHFAEDSFDIGHGHYYIKPIEYDLMKAVVLKNTVPPKLAFGEETYLGTYDSLMFAFNTPKLHNFVRENMRRIVNWISEPKNYELLSTEQVKEYLQQLAIVSGIFLHSDNQSLKRLYNSEVKVHEHFGIDLGLLCQSVRSDIISTRVALTQQDVANGNITSDNIMYIYVKGATTREQRTAFINQCGIFQFVSYYNNNHEWNTFFGVDVDVITEEYLSSCSEPMRFTSTVLNTFTGPIPRLFGTYKSLALAINTLPSGYETKDLGSVFRIARIRTNAESYNSVSKEQILDLYKLLSKVADFEDLIGDDPSKVSEESSILAAKGISFDELKAAIAPGAIEREIHHPVNIWQVPSLLLSSLPIEEQTRTLFEISKNKDFLFEVWTKWAEQVTYSADISTEMDKFIKCISALYFGIRDEIFESKTVLNSSLVVEVATKYLLDFQSSVSSFGFSPLVGEEITRKIRLLNSTANLNLFMLQQNDDYSKRLARFVLYLHSNATPLALEVYCNEQVQALFSEISQIRDPNLFKTLSELFVNLVNDIETFTLFESLSKDRSKHLILPAAVLAEKMSTVVGASPTDVDNPGAGFDESLIVNDTLKQQASQLLDSISSGFKDSARMRAFVKTLTNVMQSKEIEIQDKLELIGAALAKSGLKSIALYSSVQEAIISLEKILHLPGQISLAVAANPDEIEKPRVFALGRKVSGELIQGLLDVDFASTHNLELVHANISSSLSKLASNKKKGKSLLTNTRVQRLHAGLNKLVSQSTSFSGRSVFDNLVALQALPNFRMFASSGFLRLLEENKNPFNVAFKRGIKDSLSDSRLPVPGKIEDTIDFSGWRDPAALFAYRNNTKSGYGSEGRHETVDLIDQYILSLCSSKSAYYSLRYNVESQPFLSDLFDGEYGDVMFSKWKSGMGRFSLFEYLESFDHSKFDVSVEFDLYEHLRSIIVDHGHLPESICPFVHEAFSCTDESEFAYIINRLSVHQEEGKITHANHKAQLRLISFIKEITVSPMLLKNHFELMINISIILVEYSSLEDEQIPSQTRSSDSSYIEPSSLDQFIDDLVNIISILNDALSDVEPSGYSKISPSFSILDTDDPEMLLRSGRDVAGSCQNYEGNAGLNKSLINYILSGHIRMVCIADESNTIIARAMVKLMQKDSGVGNVMFLEEIYPKVAPKSHRIAIMQYAEDLATSFGVELVKKHEPAAPYNLFSPITSKVPFGCEYSDALRGQQFQMVHIEKSTICSTPTVEQQLSVYAGAMASSIISGAVSTVVSNFTTRSETDREVIIFSERALPSGFDAVEELECVHPEAIGEESARVGLSRNPIAC